MSPVARVLLVACAGFLAAQASLWPYCSEHITGSQDADSIYIDTVAMFPGENEIEMYIIPPCGPFEETRGTRAVACDTDAPVEVQYLNATHARALRSGSLDAHAFIFFSGVCEYSKKNNNLKARVLRKPLRVYG